MKHIADLRRLSDDELKRLIHVTSVRGGARTYTFSSAEDLLLPARWMLEWMFFLDGKKKGTPLRASYQFVKEKLKEKFNHELSAGDYWFLIEVLDVRIGLRSTDGLYIIVTDEMLIDGGVSDGAQKNIHHEMFDKVSHHILGQLSCDVEVNSKQEDRVRIAMNSLEHHYRNLEYAALLKAYSGASITQTAISDFLRKEGAAIGAVHDIKKLAAERGWYPSRSRAVKKARYELSKENEDFLRVYQSRSGLSDLNQALNNLVVSFRAINGQPLVVR